MGCSSSKDDDFAAPTLENDEEFIKGHFEEVVPEAAEKPCTTFVRGQPKPTSWLVGNGSPTAAPVLGRPAAEGPDGPEGGHARPRREADHGARRAQRAAAGAARRAQAGTSSAQGASEPRELDEDGDAAGS